MSTNEAIEKKISIIVPVYKSASYLDDCIESILKQTFTDFELLLIDDGSPDESPAICDAWAQRDERVTAIHKLNGGVSSARNIGIESAKGEYIVFIDSDDYVGENYLTDMLIAAEDKNALVLSDYRPFSDSGYEERCYSEPYIACLNEGGTTSDQFRDLVFGFRIFPPYCKLYRRDIIINDNIRFDTELKSAEDFDFNIRYLKNVEKIKYIRSIEYYYRVGYKAYVPSNHGVLGHSEIKSVHIMAHGIAALAERLDLYNVLKDEICLWAANKHYFNRLPMLFRKSDKISTADRKKLYRQLVSDCVYKELYSHGAKMLTRSVTRTIAIFCDCYEIWNLFYNLH